MTSIIVLIVINVAVAWMYASALKKYGQSYFLSVFLIAAVIPFFGIVMMHASITRAKGKSYSGNHFTVIAATTKEYDVFDDTNIDFTNIMPIYDALTLRDLKQKRKILFRSLKGNCVSLYPFLLKSLKDKDTEIVHYASSIITDYRREIYESFEKANKRYEFNPKDNIICKEYIDAFHELVCWEELNEMEIKYKRREFEKVLEVYFSQNKYIEEKYYMQKIKNEIQLEEFDIAKETCTRFISAYPERLNPYLALLDLYYYRKQHSEFKETLLCIKNKEILLSSEAAGIVSFWEDKINIDRGMK
jgi:hypothetical protein